MTNPMDADAAEQEPAATGNVSDFFGQPSASTAPALTWKGQPIGTNYTGVISGACRVQQQTDPSEGKPKYWRDGSPRWVMLIPMSLPVSERFPDGEGTYWCQGADRDELVRAMTEAGVPQGTAPEIGAGLSITYTRDKQNSMGNPTKIKTIQYVRPDQGQAEAKTEQAAEPKAKPAKSKAKAKTEQAAEQPAQQPAASAESGSGLDSDQQAILDELMAKTNG